MKRAALTLLALSPLALAACGDDAGPATEVETIQPLDTGVGDGRADAYLGPPVSKPRTDAAIGPPPTGGETPPPKGGDTPPPTGGAEPPPPAPDDGVTPPPPADAGAPPPDAEGEPPPPDVPPGDAPGNVGWIGASCAGDADCPYEGGYCLGADEGFPNGTCSQDCERICPDQAGASATFCVEGPVAGSGACVQQCDYAAFPTGCRPGYGCRLTPRYSQPDVQRQVCLPGAGDPPAENPCSDELNRRGLSYIAADNPGDHPADNPALTCDLVGPLLLRSPVGDVDYRYVDNAEPSPMFMGCELAIALDDLSAYLRELDIVELVHIGTYNCRVIAGSDSISMHGLGLAIDIHELRTSDGTTYNVEDDWEPGDNPQTPKGQFLYEFGMQMFTRGIFNIVLTPNYNAAHYNHFHVDLTPGGNFIGRGIDPHRGVFPNVSGD